MDKPIITAVDRRSFLLAIGSLSAAGFSFGKPCPPPSLTAAGGSTASTTCTAPVAGQLPALTLTAALAGTHGWTFGHPFRKGDVPSGSYVRVTGTTSQVDVRNRWSDGSVKFAVVSGITNFGANVPVGLSLTTGSTPAGTGANVSEPTNLDVSVSFSGGVTGTYTLQSCLGVDRSAWNRGAAGRVRQLLGPVMSEFHYYCPTTDGHVVVWFFVRQYSTGEAEVETVVENGWLNLSGPGERDYSVTVTVSGSTRYSGTLAHLHHTRWSRIDWIGTDPQIVPRHDGVYLRGTRMIPNYGSFGSASSGTLGSLAQPSAPFEQGMWPNDMGSAGGGGRILNRWDAIYVTSGAAAAYRSSIAHSQSAGRYAIHYRDETTGLPPNYATYPNLCYTGSGISDKAIAAAATPAPGGTAPPNYAKSHAVPFGILPYLVTGRHSFREQVQFQAQVANFCTAGLSDFAFEGARVAVPTAGAFTTRGWAWAVRSFAAAVMAVPDTDPLSGQYIAHLGKTLAYVGSQFTGTNNLGCFKGYETYTAGKTAYTNFMEDMATMVLGYASQCAFDSLATTDRTRADAFALWRMKHIVGRMGGQAADQYCGWDAATYTCVIAPTDLQPLSYSDFSAGVFANWGQVYSATIGVNNCSATNALRGNSGDDPTLLSTSDYCYWALVHTALAYAVDLGAPGAAAAWSKFVGASNYAPQGFGDYPSWSVVPR